MPGPGLDSKSAHLLNLFPFSNAMPHPTLHKGSSDCSSTHKYVATSDTLNHRQGSELIYFDYKRTLAFMEDTGQILDLFNMQYTRLVIF